MTQTLIHSINSCRDDCARRSSYLQHFEEREKTYPPPNANTNISQYFLCFGIVSDESTGIGSPRIAKSVRMLIAADEYHKGNVAKQCPLVV